MSKRVTERMSLELLLVAGMLLLVAGLAGSVYAVSQWGSADFGALDPQVILRTAIPSVVAAVLGVQTVIFGFLLGVLRLSVRELTVPSEQAPG